MEHDLATIQSLRCFNCKRFAYHDMFHGKHSAQGYLCREFTDLMAGKFK